MQYNLADHVFRRSLSHPGLLAVASETEELSYAELGRRARNIAAALQRSSGWGSAASRPPLVGILASRSADACAAVLGASWAGATYVPINVKTPEDRLLKILSICGFAVLIADAQGVKLLSERVWNAAPPLVLLPDQEGQKLTASARGCEVLAVHHLPEAAAALPPADFPPQDLAYIMFTSGTTGVPKGVMISAAAVRHFVDMVTDRLHLRETDRVLEVAELGFDFSVQNMFATWRAGASLHVLPASRVMNAVKFARERKLTVWSSVPSLIGMLRRVKTLAPGALADVRLAVFNGEPLAQGTLLAWQQAAPNSIVENLYGPTEVTVACTGQRIVAAGLITPGRDILAIGTPLPGTEAAIFNARREIVGDGEPGELGLAGIQVADGYFGDEVLTAAQFPLLNGKRWYFSGDLALRDASGNFHHLGRIDNQVKILGNRVELEEIDSHLRELSGTELVAAVAWPIVDGAAQGLVAFVCGPALNIEGLRAGLKNRLPPYMVPAKIIALSEMPLNANGKIDRRALATRLEQSSAT